MVFGHIFILRRIEVDDFAPIEYGRRHFKITAWLLAKKRLNIYMMLATWFTHIYMIERREMLSMKNKKKTPQPIRRYSDVVRRNEIIITALLFITYMALLYMLVFAATIGLR